MTLPTSRMVDNEEHAQRLAYALRELLDSLQLDNLPSLRFRAITEANKALVDYKKINPSFSL